MRSNDLEFATGPGDAMQLIDEPEHIRNMFDHVTTNDLFELIVSERIRKRSEIVNDISVTRAIRIDADRSGKLVLTTADVEDLLSGIGHAYCSSVGKSCRLIACTGWPNARDTSLMFIPSNMIASSLFNICFGIQTNSPATFSRARKRS